MIKNYFLAAYRNFFKNKTHSLINIAGLSVGMTVAMLIGLWILDEVSYNRNFAHYSKLAYVWQNSNNNGHIETWNNVPFPLGATLRKEYGADFAHVTMITGSSDHIVALGEKKLLRNGEFADPSITEMLSLHMLYGTRAGLDNPEDILISASTAKAYFGDAEPLGKVLRVDNQVDLKVTGVYADLPANCEFSGLGFLGNWDQFARMSKLDEMTNPWRPNAFTALVQVADNADMASVSQKIRDVKMRYVHKDELIHKPQLFLLPMSRWHLYSEFKNGVNTGGRIQYVWMFGLVGLFVLLLACINFMNLSTARSEKRAKEVGIRKAIGSMRGQLIYQFLGESFLVTGIALVIALLLVVFSLPYFNEVADKHMVVPWGSRRFWASILGFSVFTGIVAGSYPALYLSSFRPVSVLKGTFRAGSAAAIPRKILVVVQFTVSVIMIVGTIIVFRQIQFAKNRPIGYNKNGLVAAGMGTEDIHKHFQAVRDELLKSGVIIDMAETDSPPTAVWSTNSGFDWPGKDPGLAVDFPNADMTTEFGHTVGWEFVAGRDFSSEYASDSAAFVVNEAAVKYMGLKHPVGQIVKWDDRPYTIIGVIRDVLAESPYELVRPSFYHLAKGACDLVMFRINPLVSAHDALARVEKVFKEYNTVQPFDFHFMDEEFAKKFGDEQRVGKLAGFFAALAIFISCLGMFGMASFTAERRTKEIGIRKVLGASVAQLWSLLSGDFVALVCISLLLSLPASYLLMKNWLQNFTYRSGIAWWVFAGAAIGCLGITLMTVSYQAIRAALANPSNSLRTE